MIQQMRQRFIWVSMGAFMAVMVTVFVLLNGLNAWQTITRVEDIAIHLAQEDAHWIPPKFEHEDDEDDTPWKMDVFFGRAGQEARHRYPYYMIEWDDGQVGEVVVNQMRDVTNEIALKNTTQWLQQAKSRWKGTWYYATVDEKTVVVDATQDLEHSVRLLGLTSAIFLVCLVVVYGLLVYFSRRAIQPLLDNIQRQKEFISNASHEIKTPLAVLSTNNDILEMTGQANEWTISNRRQIKRLNQLVEQMLWLARFDEGQIVVQKEMTDIIPLVQRVSDELTPLAQDKQIEWQIQLPEHHMVNLDGQWFSQLIQILLENAIKYHVGTAPIQIVWHQKMKYLAFINECEPMSQADSQRLFERFYRVDSSRNRTTGGSGMGLSIAQSLAELNQITLSVHLNHPSEIEFRVSFRQ